MVPYLPIDADPCKLSCFEYDNPNGVWKNRPQSETNVPDGAFCSYDEPHGPICIQGKCVSADCESNISSTAVKRADRCGFCGGDNSQCENINGRISQKLVLSVLIPHHLSYTLLCNKCPTFL